MWGENESVRSSLTPRNLGVGLKLSCDLFPVESVRKSEGCRRASCGSMVKSEVSHFSGFNGRRQVCDQLVRMLSADWSIEVARSIRGEEDQMARSSA